MGDMIDAMQLSWRFLGSRSKLVQARNRGGVEGHARLVDDFYPAAFFLEVFEVRTERYFVGRGLLHHHGF